MPVVDSIGSLIRFHRERAGISMEALAYRAGVSVATVYRAENGRHRPSPATSTRIAEALGLPSGAFNDKAAPTPASGYGDGLDQQGG